MKNILHSYTKSLKALYLLMISGVGLGVGLDVWCRIGAGLWRFRRYFVAFSGIGLQNSGRKLPYFDKFF